MKNLTVSQIKDLKDTNLTTTWVNHRKRIADFEGTLFEYCLNNKYSFVKQKDKRIKISYDFGSNHYAIIVREFDLVRELVMTVSYNQIYLGDKSTISAYNPKILGRYEKQLS